MQMYNSCFVSLSLCMCVCKIWFRSVNESERIAQEMNDGFSFRLSYANAVMECLIPEWKTVMLIRLCIGGGGALYAAHYRTVLKSLWNDENRKQWDIN